MLNASHLLAAIQKASAVRKLYHVAAYIYQYVYVVSTSAAFS